jgi:GrpB-like predicted nucleotidyltransferase (UPF0157 family)
MIVVVDYDPAWLSTFAVLDARYREALVGVPLIGIEHVGSTAVPGLAAKPVIDVDIIVTDEHVRSACSALEAIGYKSLGEMGVPQRWAFLAPSGPIRTNTYVTVEGCLSLRNHLGVRDVLRSDPTLRAEYGNVKMQLALTLDDIDSYVEAKSAVIQRILSRAGIGSAERKVIELVNKA